MRVNDDYQRLKHWMGRFGFPDVAPEQIFATIKAMDEREKERNGRRVSKTEGGDAGDRGPA